MAQAWSTGPAHLFVLFPGFSPTGFAGTFANQWRYLGTAERAPQIEHRPEWEPLMNDIGGTKIPFDVSYQGTFGFVGAVLTRWNALEMEALESQPTYNTVLPGLDNPGSIGTLMMTEGAYLQLVVLFPYVGPGGKPAYATGPPCYHYWASTFWGPYKFDPGTQPAKRPVVFANYRIFTTPGSGTFGGGALLCYDNVVPAGLPPIN